MALVLLDRAKETTTVVGTGTATLLGAITGYQAFSVIGNGNTCYYTIADQIGANWEVGIGTYTSSGNTLARTTVLASSNAGGLVSFTSGVKDIFVTYPSEKGVWLDASNNAIGLGTPAAFVGTNITGTASGLTAGNVTTNANLTGAVTSSGNATSLGSFTSLQLATALTDETGSGSAVFATSPTLANPTYTGTLTGGAGVIAIGTDQIYKDTSGNVGIGTSSPATKLHLLTPSAANVELRIGNSLSYSSLLIDYAGDSRLYTPALNQIFSVNSVERMRIDSVGNVTLQENISVGGAAPTTVGTGITFPATQAASSNANTLDDYEEGVWTPVLTSGFTTSGTVTRIGYYTKVGRVVTVNFLIQATSVSPANGAVVSGLPFTATQYGIGLSINATGTLTAMSITVSGSTLIFGGVSISAGSLIGSITYIAS